MRELNKNNNNNNANYRINKQIAILQYSVWQLNTTFPFNWRSFKFCYNTKPYLLILNIGKLNGKTLLFKQLSRSRLFHSVLMSRWGSDYKELNISKELRKLSTCNF